MVIQCYFSYTNRKGDWKALHDKQAWRDLAVSVMNVEYQNDLTYFLLGEAAAGYGCGEGCEGFAMHKVVGVSN